MPVDNEELMIDNIKRLYPKLNEHFIKLALNYADTHTEDEIDNLLNKHEASEANIRDVPKETTFEIE
jgi:hypothetical protein